MKDKDYIKRIIRYSSKITKYMENIDSFSEFSINDEKVDAVIFNLEQIGETAKKLSSKVMNRYENINWKSISYICSI